MQTTTKSTIPPKKQRTLREYSGITLRGICMGAADIVPGVSGGTMAFILGIYEELIDSIRTVTHPEFIQAVLKVRIKEIFRILNWQFLLALGTGILIAILTLSNGLEWLLINQPVYLWSFFFGLVLASVYTVSKRVSEWDSSKLIASAVGAIAAYFLVGAVPLQTSNAWWFLFLSGALAICAMILPGISGAFILVLLGKYQFVLGAVNDRDIVSIGIIGIGAIVGLVTFAQVIGYFFKQHHDMTVAILTGLMIGSLRKIWPWKLDVAWLTDTAGSYIMNSDGHRVVIEQINQLPDVSSGSGVTQLVFSIVLALAGFGGIILLDKVAGSHEK